MPSPHDIPALTTFVGDALPTLQLSDGLFCFDKLYGASELRGRSVRYSILVLLGLLKQEQAGGTPSLDLHALHAAIVREVDTLGVGDLGLLLWAEARMAASRMADTAARLRVASADATKLAPLEGMEAAWSVIGAVEARVAGLATGDLVTRAFDTLLSRKSPESALFRHLGDGTWRATFPNFATQVYSLLALAGVAKHALDPRAAQLGRDLGDTLVALRLPDSGWPWLYHADRAVVIEPYEVYSVHQDAMAPMAFFALAEATGRQEYARAAVEGFQWCFGKNELGFNFYDVPGRFAHRSIKRAGAAHTLNLWANTGLGGVLGVDARTGLGGVEINRTCRPYHLGWILEAWCGREQLHTLAG